MIDSQTSFSSNLPELVKELRRQGLFDRIISIEEHECDNTIIIECTLHGGKYLETKLSNKKTQTKAERAFEAGRGLIE